MTVEYGEHGRPRSSAFPASWGFPRGRQYSEERAAWVREHVDEERRRRPHEQLAKAAVRYLAILRSAELDARRDGPVR